MSQQLHYTQTPKPNQNKQTQRTPTTSNIPNSQNSKLTKQKAKTKQLKTNNNGRNPDTTITHYQSSYPITTRNNQQTIQLNPS